MAITSAICNSFKQEILEAEHNFTASSGNTFNLALYDSDATLNKSTTVYTTSEELATKTSGTYLSQYFPQGLLYACLVEAYGFLKGPMDMLTLYDNKYKNAIQQFAGMQLGRRRRDDYTDGTVRIPVKSPSP